MAKSKSKRSRVFLIAAIIIVAGLGVWYATRAKSTSTAKKTTPTTTETKKAAEANTAKTDATIDKDAPATSSNTTTSSSNNKLYILVNQPVKTADLNKDMAVRSTISGATSGTCTLQLVGPNNKTISKTTDITAQTSYYSCSFDIPQANLAAGEWTLNLTATSGDANATYTAKVTMQ